MKDERECMWLTEPMAHERLPLDLNPQFGQAWVTEDRAKLMTIRVIARSIGMTIAGTIKST
jgi:hypothetical protein